MKNSLEKLTRLFHTLKYYRKSQLGWYLYYRGRRLVPVSFWFSPQGFLNVGPDNKKLEKLRDFIKVWAECPYGNRLEVKKILDGQIEYAGESYNLDHFLAGKEEGLSPLARYGFHSFEFLWQLCLFFLCTGDSSIEKFAKECVLKWITSNPIGKPIAWDPYPTSYRIRYILSACALWNWNDEQILKSVWTQIQYLIKSLEFHLLGNHLIQNVCGVLVGAEIFSLPAKEKLLKILEKELKEQILEDGGHYERVPMYHYHVLLDLLWLVAVMEPIPEFLKGSISKMVGFAKNITLSDGNYPLFGDSVYYHLPGWKTVSWVVSKLTGEEVDKDKPETELIKLIDSGYYVCRYASGNKKIEFVIRGGKSGPDFQLAHAHSDQLSYELLIDGKRFVVDSGVYGYAGNPYRAFQRSSKAHNIVWIDGVEQLETWGVFRVARRGNCEIEKVQFDGKTFKFVATYYFYTGERHKRIIDFDYPYMTVRDEIYCLPKRRKIYNFIHFHPDVDVKKEDSYIIATGYGKKVELELSEGCYIILKKGSEDFSQGWYSERFGCSVPNTVVVMEKRNTDKLRDFVFNYKFRFD